VGLAGQVISLSTVGLDRAKPKKGDGLVQLALQGIATRFKLNIFMQVYEDLLFFLFFLLCLHYFFVLPSLSSDAA
jgi:hypothetical protein